MSNVREKTMPRRLSYVIPVLALPAVLATIGCTSGSSKGTPTAVGTTSSADGTSSCPAGWTAWNFGGSNAIGTNSSSYEQTLGDAAVLSPPVSSAITLQSATCGATSTSLGAAFNCSGRTSCSFPAPACDAGAYSVTYSCGTADVDGDSGAPRIHTATAAMSGAVSLTCPSVDAGVPTVAGPTGQSCVPKQCLAQSRRDVNMNCAADLTMPVVNLDRSTFEPVTFTEVVPAMTDMVTAGLPNTDAEAELFFGPRTPTDKLGSRPWRFLHANTDYSMQVSGLLSASTGGLNAKMVVWLEDELVTDADVTISPTLAFPEAQDLPDQRDIHPHGFRCTVGNFDVTTAPNGSFSATITGQLPTGCTEPPGAARIVQDAAWSSGYDDVSGLGDVRYYRTRVYAAFDPEGNVASVGVGQTDSSACQPNPLQFFYDAKHNRYDVSSYYRQRDVTPSIYQRQVIQQGRTVADTGYVLTPPTRIEIGPKEISLPNPSLHASLYTTVQPTIPVSFTWYMANDTPENPTSPDGNFANATSGFADPKVTTNYSKDNWTPPNLRANVYLLPPKGTPTGDYGLLATVPLTTALPNGSTLSSNFSVSASLTTQFFQKTSPYYVDPTITAGVNFNVFACIVSDDGEFEPRWYLSSATQSFDAFPHWSFQSNTVGGRDVFTVPTSELAAEDQVNFPTVGYSSVWSMALDNAASAAASNSDPNKQHRGCRYASAPLNVTVDTYKRPLPPTSHGLWSGFQSPSSSGDSTMSGTADNDSVQTCTGANQTDCTLKTVHTVAGDGNFAQTYFSTSITSTTDRGTKAGVDGTAEMLSFQVLDPQDAADDSGDDVPWPTSSTPIHLTVEPPWDAIWKALKKESAEEPEEEWTKGYHAGVEGLGFAIGYKIPIEIGPIPGVVMIGGTVGVGLEANLDLQFAPDDGDGTYPCIGGSNCYQYSGSDQQTQADAASQCAQGGGRLAEMSSANEAAGLVNALSGHEESGSAWVGGQLAYDNSNPCCFPGNAGGNAASCAKTTPATCAATEGTSYRWLASDTEFATATGNPATANASLVSGQVFNAGNGPLYTQYPNNAGVALDRTGNLVATTTSTQLPYVCEYDYATSAVFLKQSLDLHIGASAGIELDFCVPSDDVGLCLQGEFDIVDLSIEPTLSRAQWLLMRNSSPYGSRETYSLDVPWELGLFAGEIDVVLNLWLFSSSYTLVHYDGIKLAEGDLYSASFPVSYNY